MAGFRRVIAKINIGEIQRAAVKCTGINFGYLSAILQEPGIMDREFRGRWETHSGETGDFRVFVFEEPQTWGGLVVRQLHENFMIAFGRQKKRSRSQKRK